MNFLIFFAIFVATILLSIVLERLINSPVLVSILLFAIYLIVITALFAFGTVTDFPLAILIVTIYAIISYITALIVRFIRCICNRYLNECCNTCPNNENQQIIDSNFEPQLNNNRNTNNIRY